MRPIKFRVRNVDKGCYEMGLTFRVDFNMNDYKSWFLLEQYTGLRDKNGNEVFEGDIVRLDDGDVSHHEIYWDKDRASFFDRRLEDGDSLSGYEDLCIEFVREGKVVGTIHDDRFKDF